MVRQRAFGALRPWNVYINYIIRVILCEYGCINYVFFSGNFSSKFDLLSEHGPTVRSFSQKERAEASGNPLNNAF